MQPASDCQIQRFHVVISYSGPLTFTPALAPPTALTFPLPLTCSLSPQLLKQKLVTQFEECRKAFRLAPASAPSTTNNGLTLTLLAAPLTMTTVALSISTNSKSCSSDSMCSSKLRARCHPAVSAPRCQCPSLSVPPCCQCPSLSVPLAASAPPLLSVALSSSCSSSSSSEPRLLGQKVVQQNGP